MMKKVIILALCLVALFALLSSTEARSPLVAQIERSRRFNNHLKNRIHKLKKELNTLSDAMIESSPKADNWCPPQKDTKTDEDINKLIASIQTEKCLDGQLRTLNNFINLDSLSFTGAQALKIIPQFSEFVFVQSAVIDMLRPKISGIYISEAVQLLSKLASSSEKLKLLESLKNTIYELVDNKQALIDLFTSPADKAQAEQILLNAKGRNCIFGSVDEPEVAIVIDVSGSMEVVFKKPDGTQLDRITYVKEQLVSLIAGLQPNQLFNIYHFSGDVKIWANAPVQATPENVEKALAYVKALETRWTGTNISDALKAAFQKGTANLKAIYLLSDGQPNGGITDLARMKAEIAQWNKQRQTPVVVNTVAFTLGHYLAKNKESETAAQKKNATIFMRGIADATGGMYKMFDDGTHG